MPETNEGAMSSLEKPARTGFLGPLAILTAITLGSAVAIEFGLASVWVIFWILRSESDEVAFEVGRLPWYCLVFLVLATVSTAAMYSLMKALPWRWRAQTAMWALVAAIGTWFTVFRR